MPRILASRLDFSPTLGAISFHNGNGVYELITKIVRANQNARNGIPEVKHFVMPFIPY